MHGANMKKVEGTYVC